MSIDASMAKKIVDLAQIETSEKEIASLVVELSKILEFMEQLNDLDVEGIEPMTSITVSYTHLTLPTIYSV